jgi:hypothetical protein
MDKDAIDDMSLDDLEIYLRKMRRMFSTYNDFQNADYVNSYLYGMAVRSKKLSARHNFIMSQSEVVENVIMDEEVDMTHKDTDFSMTDGGVKFNLSLDDFFKRPVKIFSTVLTLNNLDFLNDKAFDPWDEWSKNPGVRSKLKNYYYFRGDMKLRFVFNSTRYHYGTVLISNQPYPSSNDNLLALTHIKLNGSADRQDTNAFVNYLSQSPEVVYAKIGVDNNIEMSIPFVSCKPSWAIYDDDADEVADGSSFVDFAGATNVLMSYINPIRVANNDFASDVPVQVYAWVENVKLGPITATKMAISQSKTEGPSSSFDKARTSINSNKVLNSIAEAGEKYVDDEYADAGPISKIASAASNLAGKLSSVPVVGGVALATSKVSGGLAKVSKMFGFSKVPDIRGVTFVKPMAATNFSTTVGYDMVQKLTLDEKQELSIALPGMAPDKDEMAISTICSKEAFLTNFDWNVTDVPGESTIFRLPVSPGNLSSPVLDGLQHTPLSMVSSHFRYWRGDITFRIEVVASQFHRGKLLIFWEPNLNQANLTNLSFSNPQDLNLQYAYYMDLEDKRDIEITIGFTSDLNFKLTNIDSFDTSNRKSEIINGLLCFTPFTELTTPSIAGNNDSIQVNIYVKSDNMVFAGPELANNFFELTDSIELQSQSKTVSSSFQPYASQSTGGQGIKTSVENVVLNKVTSDHTGIHRHHFGEEIISFRSLLKRTFHTGLYKLEKSLNSSNLTDFRFDFDIYPDYFNTSASVGGTVVPIATESNFDETLYNRTHYESLRKCFLFQKGGFRHKFVFHGNTSSAVASVAFSPLKSGRGNWMTNVSTNSDNPQLFGLPTADALNVYDLSLNKIVEIEVPFYTPLLMFPTNCQYALPLVYANNAYPFRVGISHTLKVEYGAMATGETRLISHFSSIAEDFSFHRFQGAFLVSKDSFVSSSKYNAVIVHEEDNPTA